MRVSRGITVTVVPAMELAKRSSWLHSALRTIQRKGMYCATIVEHILPKSKNKIYIYIYSYLKGLGFYFVKFFLGGSYFVKYFFWSVRYSNKQWKPLSSPNQSWLLWCKLLRFAHSKIKQRWVSHSRPWTYNSILIDRITAYRDHCSNNCCRAGRSTAWSTKVPAVSHQRKTADMDCTE